MSILAKLCQLGNSTQLALVLLFLSAAGCVHSHKGPAHHNPAAHKQDKKHDHKEMTHDFSDAEKWSKVFNSKERDEWQKPQYVVDLLQVKPGMTVADLGAGTGYFLPYLDREVTKGGKVIAIEVEQSLVDFMNKLIKKKGTQKHIRAASSL